MSRHKERAIERAKQSTPKNVSVIIDGITKVLTWKEYQNYLNPEEEV